MIRSILREPLLQFLVLGAVLFGLHALIDKKDAERPERIVISAARINNLGESFARTWQRRPTERELQSLIDNDIRDEVFYRAGRAAGLDRDDFVIRRRLRQKVEFLAEDLSAPEPSEAELSDYLAAHPDRFRTEDRLSFHHVFLSAARRADATDDDLARIAARLTRTDAAAEAATLGDPFLLGEEFQQISRRDVARTFGEKFADEIFAVDQDRWLGPLTSSFGRHFVFVRERTPGYVPPLDAARDAVRREWSEARRLEAEERLYRTLRGRYEIVLETRPTATPADAAIKSEDTAEQSRNDAGKQSGKAGQTAKR